MTRCYLLLIFFTTLAGCKEPKQPSVKTTRAFYYWKSIYKNNTYEQAVLKKLDARTVFIKFFDVDWNYEENKCYPLAQIQFADKPDTSLNIIPCVFITNRSLLNADSTGIPELAANISKLIQGITEQNSLQASVEIQIDCDWTEKTKSKYFFLLAELRKLNFFRDKILSATIRLFQVKFKKQCGIPPADKGLLMAYNMGNLKNPASANSILDTKELAEYAEFIGTYPLKLDIALPLFGWYVWFDANSRYKGLLHDFDIPSPETFPVEKKDNRFVFQTDFIAAGYSFHAGDVLRKETSAAGEVIQAGKIISRFIKSGDRILSGFHLDSITLSKYSSDDLEKIFNSLNH